MLISVTELNDHLSWSSSITLFGNDTNNRLRVYFHDTVKRITVDIKTTTDNDGLINGYELINSSYDHNDDDNDDEHSDYDHNDDDDEHSSIKINHHLILWLIRSTLSFALKKVLTCIDHHYYYFNCIFFD